ncbi:polysaccharide deacetylase family protein [Alistipes sp. ZOR0009]|uniref:polysaccharide deacetylase family protein n=1 Tax=Alistipes sp. ZOR0009 TaxID=1339253 RepID=UPI0006492486|nr:polysaccharide deacetylase family protein [Alistipes sp. ZOR0009]
MYVAILIVGLLLLAVYASVSISSGVYLKAFCRAKDGGRAIALTFDDGPDPTWTPKVLEVLRRYNVKATFFCIGDKVDRHPLLAKQLVDEGHLIGNHTYHHASFFPLLSQKKMVAELQRCDEAIGKVTGELVTLFRPPFGVTNPTVGAAVRKQAYKVIGWSIRSFDTVKSEREVVLRRILKKAHAGGVILMHDNLEGSDWLVEQVILGLHAQGYEIKRIDELFEI